MNSKFKEVIVIGLIIFLGFDKVFKRKGPVDLSRCIVGLATPPANLLRCTGPHECYALAALRRCSADGTDIFPRSGTFKS